MDINKVLAKMINAEDYEMVYMGGMIKSHLDKWLGEMESGFGLSRDAAERCLANYCAEKVESMENGEDFDFPNYRDELLEEAAVAGSCRLAA